MHTANHKGVIIVISTGGIVFPQDQTFIFFSILFTFCHKVPLCPLGNPIASPKRALPLYMGYTFWSPNDMRHFFLVIPRCRPVPAYTSASPKAP